MDRKYKNKTGIVTKIDDKEIYIDDDLFLVDTQRSQERIQRANPFVGAKVEFNFQEKSGELIYLRVLNPYYEGRESVRHQSSGSSGYIFGLGGHGEMANMSLASHDPYDEFCDGDTM